MPNHIYKQKYEDLINCNAQQLAIQLFSIFLSFMHIVTLIEQINMLTFLSQKRGSQKKNIFQATLKMILNISNFQL